MNNSPGDPAMERLHLLIQREVDGMIQPEEEAELHQALACSDELRRAYEEARHLAELLQQDRSNLSVPANLTDSICASLSSRDRSWQRVPTWTWRSLVTPAAMAASVMILVGLSFWAGRQGVSADNPEGAGGILPTKQELLLKYPELDSSQVEKLYERCLRQIEAVEARSQAEKLTALSTLEKEMQKLLLKARHKEAERK